MSLKEYRNNESVSNKLCRVPSILDAASASEVSG